MSTNSDLMVRVSRRRESLRPALANCIDRLELREAGVVLFRCRVQTVVNIPGAHYKDTIAPGPFLLKAFVDPRKFCGRIHGICATHDLDGQLIDERSIEPYPTEPLEIAGQAGQLYAPPDDDRWLLHDRRKKAPNPGGELYDQAWSAGCFVMWDPANLEAFGDLLIAHGVRRGDFIQGELVAWELAGDRVFTPSPSAVENERTGLGGQT